MRYLALLLLAVLPGCFANAVEDDDADEEEDGGEEVGETSQAISVAPDNGWRGVFKTGAFVTCNGRNLRATPGGAKLVHEGAPDIMKKGRPVLVQKYPGAITADDGNKYVWVDPDFWGIGRYSEEEGDTDEMIAQKRRVAQRELDDRFGTRPRVSAADVHAGKFETANRRGWFPLACLDAAKDGEKLPRVPRLKDKFGNGRRVKGKYVAQRVDGGCLVDDPQNNKAVGYEKDDGHVTKYWSYGTYLAGGSGVYLEYNTPSAKPKGSTKIGGGGFTQMYLPTNSKFWVLQNSEKVDVRLKRVSGTRDPKDGHWSYGYTKLDVKGGTEKVYGWVYTKCLLPRGAVADSCAGKADGMYCSSGNPNGGYRCAGGELTAVSCQDGFKCVGASADGASLQCTQ